MALPDLGEEWPEGEEPPPEEQETEGDDESPRRMMRGFSLMGACSLWLLEAGQYDHYVSWLKFRRIPFHRKHAANVRRMHNGLRHLR
jgi:hypothetical protein